MLSVKTDFHQFKSQWSQSEQNYGKIASNVKNSSDKERNALISE